MEASRLVEEARAKAEEIVQQDIQQARKEAEKEAEMIIAEAKKRAEEILAHKADKKKLKSILDSILFSEFR